jgi:large subunit ribosomal protein L4
MKLEVYNINGENLGREVDLPDNVFGLELNEKHDHVVYLAVKKYLAAQRQGTHKSKGRAEIKGSTRKIKKQKGTGTARAGSIKNPLFRGGGRVFGPEPRDYSIKLNKKVKQLARKSALSSKAQEGAIIVVEDFTFEAAKTKTYLQLLTSLKNGENNLTDTKSLLVLDTPHAVVAPVKPKLPTKTRGAKKKAAFAEAMKTYSEDLKSYNEAYQIYLKSVEVHLDKVEKSYDNIVLSSRNLQKAVVADAKTLNTYQILNANCLVVSESAVSRLAEMLS